MKLKLILLQIALLPVLLLFSQSSIQDNVFDESKVFVRVNKLNQENLKSLKRFGKIIDFKEEKIIVSNLDNNIGNIIDIDWLVLSVENIEIKNIKKLDNVKYVSYFMRNKNGKSYAPTGIIYAKLKNSEFNRVKTKIEAKYKVNIIDLIGYSKNVFKIA